MEVKHKNKIHLFHNLSLKWSFVIYVTICILIALLLSVCLSGLFSQLQNNIHEYYHELYKDEYAKQAHLMVDGQVVQQPECSAGVWIYTESISDKYSKQDTMLYDLYGVLAIVVVPVIFVLCVIVTGVVFYQKKLKKPLMILDSASAHIAAGELDYKVTYESGNEFGRLAASFEIMRESLYETNREMWRMMEGRRRLNAAFAHDLRTPLTVLRGYCDFLLKYIPEGKVDSKKALSTLSTMDVYLKRLEGYTSTMSSLQKLDEIDLIPKQVDVEEFCEELKNTGKLLTKNKKLVFTGNGTGQLDLDKAAITQVYENLMSNAVRYGEHVIRVSCHAIGNTFNISVSDDGPGFTKEALKSASEPYYRDEKEVSDTVHFGIGLYICRLLCEKHGGGLTVENDHGGKVTASFFSIYD